MDVPQMISDLTAHFESWKSAAVADAEKFAAAHLPLLNGLKAVADNPVVQAILRAEHISPEFLSALASVIDRTEESLATAEAAKNAAEAAAAGAQAGQEAPAPPEPAPAG